MGGNLDDEDEEDEVDTRQFGAYNKETQGLYMLFSKFSASKFVKKLQKILLE